MKLTLLIAVLLASPVAHADSEHAVFLDVTVLGLSNGAALNYSHVVDNVGVRVGYSSGIMLFYGDVVGVGHGPSVSAVFLLGEHAVRTELNLGVTLVFDPSATIDEHPWATVQLGPGIALSPDVFVGWRAELGDGLLLRWGLTRFAAWALGPVVSVGWTW